MHYTMGKCLAQEIGKGGTAVIERKHQGQGLHLIFCGNDLFRVVQYCKARAENFTLAFMNTKCFPSTFCYIAVKVCRVFFHLWT